MNIKLIANVIGSLFPVIFPEQQFNPRRALGALVAFLVAILAINWIGADATVQAIEIAEEFIDLAEE